MNKSKDMNLRLIIPHILYAKWSIEKNSIKEFIKKFGYWSWERSKPALKIYINDNNIIGEQFSSYLDLDEGDNECMFFVPYYNKTYRAEFGRYLEKSIFIPFLYSKNIKILQESNHSIFRLPDNFIIRQ